mmetsp:Transcript_6821/g.8460  ORF Transcript_6821/g.8460 Transcript_6821/m.8460 type:complete len:281 (-) Transcript_6821:249-1091(-)|eukprot:CAMPEP_0172516554 /NCGR_PEP_ID=MMETSP1066-20121228/277089_1 /TAXON_ID=671091 /ORGANISM="Coscinodiscus wailesii, Strain CCMP2513" /LENGTH=280 /DNA_ID=CAMNT_0013298087 /DNA_START=336 /DNA_END=1178 /DNA_ORIENTATION=-
MKAQKPLYKLLFLLLSILSASLCPHLAIATSTSQKTYYEILDVPKDAKLRDIKKAYRRLALEHHPDRNKGKEEESTLRFREVNEAYEVLSDASKRGQYDAMLNSNGGSSSSGWDGSRFDSDWFNRQGGERDPFAQFNDLFQNDPFFADAFKNMDDLFSRTFAEGKTTGGRRGPEPSSGGLGDMFGRAGEAVLNMMGGSVKFSSSYSNGRTASSRSYSSSSSSSYSTYTSKSTRTVIENGRRVTIQSMEKDGNRIEEKYEGDTLVQRLVNGVPHDLSIEDH